MLAEQRVHSGGAFLQDRAQLVGVHPLVDGRAAVADEAGDVLDAQPGLRQQRDEAVPQLARRPGVGIEPGGGNDTAECAQDVVAILLGAGAGAEDESVGGGCTVMATALSGEGVDDEVGEIAQCDLWFPPIMLPVGSDRTRKPTQLPVPSQLYSIRSVPARCPRCCEQDSRRAGPSKHSNGDLVRVGHRWTCADRSWCRRYGGG